MTDDPMKLFVIVMAVLLAVLGFVAYQSWSQASAYEVALASAQDDAKSFREYGADVRRLCEQLRGTRIAGKSPKSMFDELATNNGFRLTQIKEDLDVTRGGNVKEKRFVVQLSRTQGTAPLPRDKIARFCRDVEQYSNGLLKTIELRLSRQTGRDQTELGKVDEVVDDKYTFDAVFGYRYIPVE